jgi:hypothetical protein
VRWDRPRQKGERRKRGTTKAFPRGPPSSPIDNHSVGSRYVLSSPHNHDGVGYLILMHVRTEYYTIIHRCLLKERTQLQLLPSPSSPLKEVDRARIIVNRHSSLSTRGMQFEMMMKCCHRQQQKHNNQFLYTEEHIFTKSHMLPCSLSNRRRS